MSILTTMKFCVHVDNKIIVRVPMVQNISCSVTRQDQWYHRINSRFGGFNAEIFRKVWTLKAGHPWPFFMVVARVSSQTDESDMVAVAVLAMVDVVVNSTSVQVYIMMALLVSDMHVPCIATPQNNISRTVTYRFISHNWGISCTVPLICDDTDMRVEFEVAKEGASNRVGPTTVMITAAYTTVESRLSVTHVHFWDYYDLFRDLKLFTKLGEERYLYRIVMVFDLGTWGWGVIVSCQGVSSWFSFVVLLALLPLFLAWFLVWTLLMCRAGDHWWHQKAQM